MNNYGQQTGGFGTNIGGSSTERPTPNQEPQKVQQLKGANGSFVRKLNMDELLGYVDVHVGNGVYINNFVIKQHENGSLMALSPSHKTDKINPETQKPEYNTHVKILGKDEQESAQLRSEFLKYVIEEFNSAK